MSIELKNEIRQQACDSLQRYCTEHFEEPIGNLKAQHLLDFILQEIGPCIYNRAVQDVQAHLLTRVQELDFEVHEEEFGYWSQQKKRRWRHPLASFDVTAN